MQVLISVFGTERRRLRETWWVLAHSRAHHEAGRVNRLALLAVTLPGAHDTEETVLEVIIGETIHTLTVL